MRLHRNAKLGLAGRFALVQACRAGSVDAGGGDPLQRLAGDRLPLGSALAAGERAGALHTRLPARSLEPTEAYAATAACERATSHLRRQAAHRLGSAAADGAHRLCPLDDLEGARAPRPLARRRGRHASPPVATSGPVPATSCTWTSSHYARFTRPGHALTGDRSTRLPRSGAKVGYDFAHAIVDDHSRLAYAELLGDERAASVTAFLERALAFFAERGIEPKRLMTDNAWSYTLEPLAARAPRRARHRACAHAQATTAAQRQGRALPPDDGPRVGLRRPLSLLSTPCLRTATLAPLLQRAQTAQLARWPTPDQPRSQPLWADS